MKKNQKKILIIVGILLIIFLCFIQINKNTIIKEKFVPDDFVAVIVEPRKHKHLHAVIDNVKEMIPSAKIQIFHGTHNYDYIYDKFKKDIDSGKIKCSNLNKENLPIEEYNVLLMSTDFWENIDGENVLIFQTDSGICTKDDSILDEFSKFDYSGAPWIHIPDKKGGNGGFSLRKKSKILELLKKYKNNPYHSNPINEDIFFSDNLKNGAPPNLSKNFSVETIFYDKPYAIHKPWRHLGSDQIQKIEENCPILKIIKH